MTLKENFENILHNYIDNEYSRRDASILLEIDANEFSIGFAEWVECSKTYYTPMKELLEIYKKEEGL